MLRQAGWAEHVNEPQTEAEATSLRRSLERGVPLGDESWTQRVVRRLNLESTVRPRGRSRKENGS